MAHGMSVEDGSLLFPESIWTAANIDLLIEHFVENPLEDDDDFVSKLKRQLGDQPREVVRLMAETIAVYLAFAVTAVGPARKRELIGDVLAFKGDDLAADSDVAKAMDGGIGGPGQGYNSYRPFLLMYLVRFARALKALDSSQRADLVAAGADPWAFREWLDSVVPDPKEGAQTMRNILLHLLFPDSFERIAVPEDKAQIVNALGALVEGLDEDEDLDRALFAIRGRLEELMPDGQRSIGGEIDFYYTPLRESWDPDEARGERRSDRGLSSLAALQYKQQVVLYGPPGTGKTCEAKQLAEQLIRREALRRWGPVKYLSSEARVREVIAAQIRRRQLHPAYSYEDFIAGLRLTPEGTVPVKGHLLQLIDEIEQAGENSPDPSPLPWVLILDELNRADLSRLLGEVFSALDDRGAAIELSAAGTEEWPPLRLPSDLFVIGTMNLIDQSVEQLDFALRRRFFWLLAGFREDLIVPVVEQRWRALDLSQLPWLSRHGWEHMHDDVERLAARSSPAPWGNSTSASRTGVR
jgi:5-methylcytosine-specific restriction protein B